MSLRRPLDPTVVVETVFDALIAARETYGDKEILEDQDRKPLTYTGLIRAAFVLGRKIAAMTAPEERVGILLPSSMGVVVTFYGLHAHGRVPHKATARRYRVSSRKSDGSDHRHRPIERIKVDPPPSRRERSSNARQVTRLRQ